MSKLEDFEDIPYEDEPRYTAADVQRIIKQTEIKLRNNYMCDKLKYIEKEKEFYKNTVMAIFQNIKHFGGTSGKDN